MMTSAVPSESGRALALGRVHVFAIDEQDHVRVLLERARLTQVRQLRPMVAARLRRAAQLAERDDGHLQFLREDLQRPRNGREFLLAVVEPAAPLHQLKVIDDEHVEAVLHLQASCLGAHFEDADRRGVVDEDLGVVHARERGHQPVVVVFAQEPAAEAVGVHARLGRQQAHEQLFLGHLEAEDPHALARLDGAVHRHVEHEARLPHRRPGRDDDQVGRLEPRRHLIEIDKPARNARDQALVFLQLLDQFVPGVHELAERHEAGAQPMLGDLEDRPFGLVQQVVGVLFRVVGAPQDLGRRLDQPAERGLFLDDPGVVLDVSRPRHAVGERRHIGRPADVVEFPRPGQLVLQRDRIDRLAALGQPHHLLEDPPVCVAEEILGIDDFRRLVERRIVDENRTEHTLLRLEVVRKRAVGGHGGGQVTTNNSKLTTNNSHTVKP